jgi:putative oxidoreductase
MERFLGNFSNQIYGLMRIVIGASFALHGAQKLLGFFGGQTPPLLSQFWIGGVIELVGGTLVAIGLFAGYAAFLCSGMMVVAYLQFHWFGGQNPGFWPILNGGEKALMYALVFLFIASRGGGSLSLSQVFAGGKD